MSGLRGFLLAVALVAFAHECALGYLVEDQGLAAVDWTTLSFADWQALQSNWALDTLYQQGPRVRAKVLVATRLSSQQFFGGATLFKQQVSGVLNTSLDCVHFEFLETIARTEIQQAAFTVAIGISALCQLVGVTSLATNMTTAIERERARIAVALVDSVTIPSLQLFGVTMTLVDLTIDGELFYPMDFQPWVLARFAVSSSSSDEANESYLMSNDMFQQLRLRMLLARHMRPIRVSPNDVLIRAVQPIPDATYSTAGTVLISVEIHVLTDQFFKAVDGYLRNQSLVQEFHNLEPEFVLRAVDVDVSAGRLYDSSDLSESSNADGASGSLYRSLEFSFAVANVSFAYLESRKRRILEQTRTALVSMIDAAALNSDAYELSFGRLIADDEDTSNTIDSTHWMLSFRLAISQQDVHSPVLNTNSIDNLNLSSLLGFQESLDSDTVHVSYGGLQVWSEPYGEMNLSPPFVRFTITIELASAGVETNQTVILEQGGSANILDFFQEQRIRFALIDLLKQVHVTDNDQLVLVKMSPGSLKADDVTTSVELGYDISVQDESQREGIKTMVLSQRLQLLILASSNNQMSVRKRTIDLHADGSPAPSMNFILPGTCSMYNAIQSESISPSNFVYRYDDPIIDTNPAILYLNNETACDNNQGICLILNLRSFSARNESIFLRQIDSTNSLTSKSLLLWSSTSNTTTSMPAPWIKSSINGSSMSLWAFSMDVLNLNSSHAMRFWFETSNSSSNWAYLLDVHWNESRLWITSNLIQKILREPTAIPIQSENESIVFLVNNSAKTTSAIELDVHIISRTCLGGIFCVDTSDQSDCSTCVDAIDACKNSVECRALASCFGSFITANPLLYFELRENLQTQDITFVLAQCLEKSWWSDKSRELFLRAFWCGIQKECRMGMTSTTRNFPALVFSYEPMEQTLAYAGESFQTSLGLLVDSVDGASTATLSLRNFTNEQTSLNELQSSLFRIYGNRSNGMVINVTLKNTVSASLSTSWTVRIQYYFLPSGVQLPFFMVEQGDSPSISTTKAADSLEVRVHQ